MRAKNPSASLLILTVSTRTAGMHSDVAQSLANTIRQLGALVGGEI